MEIQNSSKVAPISQCMIVKNEEKHIRQALSWGKGIVAEQIVVDTGSTDRTVEVEHFIGRKTFSLFSGANFERICWGRGFIISHGMAIFRRQRTLPSARRGVIGSPFWMRMSIFPGRMQRSFRIALRSYGAADMRGS